MPGLESLRLRGDGAIVNSLLLTVQISGVHVFVHWIDDARLDTGKEHGFVGRLLRPYADRLKACFSPSQPSDKEPVLRTVKAAIQRQTVTDNWA
jgi:hypothetical protein